MFSPKLPPFPPFLHSFLLGHFFESVPLFYIRGFIVSQNNLVFKVPAKCFLSKAILDNCFFEIDIVIIALLNVLLMYETQSAFTCSKLAIETPEQGVNYVQS